MSSIQVGVNQFSFPRYYGEILKRETDPQERS